MEKIKGVACVLGGFVLAIVFFAVTGAFNKGMLQAAYNKGVTYENDVTFKSCKTGGLVQLNDETGKSIHFSCVYAEKSE